VLTEDLVYHLKSRGASQVLSCTWRSVVGGDGSAVSDLKQELHRNLQASRATLLSKLDDLSEYDRRRPMTATGTNLLGLVKHLAGLEYGYLGESFGRPARGSGVAARLRAIRWVDPESRATVSRLSGPPPCSDGPTQSDQATLACTDWVVSPCAARSCCSACVRVCKFSAGPATAANTHPHTSTSSATVPRAADPTPHRALSISDPRP
jgi:Protein of unknown function (DUF664)